MTAAGETVTILLVEDHPVVRIGLRALVDAQPDLRTVAEADSVQTALAGFARHRPHLVVLPLRLEGGFRGVELCRELLAADTGARLLVYTSYNSRDDATAAFLCGAHSYVHKTEDADRLLDTIRATAAGRRVWLLGADPERADEPAAHGISAGQLDAGRLTRRERQVLTLMMKRLTNAEIAATLHVELATVKTHVSNLLAKLGLRSRRELF